MPICQSNVFAPNMIHRYLYVYVSFYKPDKLKKNDEKWRHNTNNGSLLVVHSNLFTTNIFFISYTDPLNLFSLD